MENAKSVKGKYVKRLRDEVMRLAMDGRLVDSETGEVIENPLVDVQTQNGHVKPSSNFVKVMHKGENTDFLLDTVSKCGEYARYLLVIPCFCHHDNEFDSKAFRERAITSKSSYFRFRNVMIECGVLAEIKGRTYLNPRIAFYGEAIDIRLLEAFGYDYKNNRI